MSFLAHLADGPVIPGVCQFCGAATGDDGSRCDRCEGDPGPVPPPEAA